MDNSPISNIDVLFDRIRSYDIGSDDGWNFVRGAGLSRRQLPNGIPLLRARYTLDIPFGEGLVLIRPTVFLHPRRPEFDDAVAECGIEELLAPGDAIAWVRFRFSPLFQRLSSLVDRVRIGVAGLADRDDSNPWSRRHRIRFAIRRDFPSAGKIAVVSAPLQPSTSEMLEEWGIMSATVGFSEVHPEDATKMLVQQVMQFRRTLMLPLAAGGKHMGVFHWIPRYRGSCLQAEATSGAARYVVLSLQRYQRGAPMLPAEAGEESAAVFGFVPSSRDAGDFSLARYLRAFLKRLPGCEPQAVAQAAAQIYDSLDGRCLVPYQAVATCSAWDVAWAALKEPFRTQRGAYRRIFGGTIAPEIKVGQAPRFISVLDSALAWPSSGGVGGELSVSERQTFVHFSAAAPVRPHFGSEPTLEAQTEPILKTQSEPTLNAVEAQSESLHY